MARGCPGQLLCTHHACGPPGRLTVVLATRWYPLHHITHTSIKRWFWLCSMPELTEVAEQMWAVQWLSCSRVDQLNVVTCGRLMCLVNP
jgi:hypothetical protein